MNRIIARVAAGSLVLAQIGSAAAQEACVDPITQLVDAEATAAWMADLANADALAMAELAGTWTGPTGDPGDTRSVLTVAYATDGTLTFLLHQCGQLATDPCYDIEGMGTWAAAYGENVGTVQFGRMLVAPGVLVALCQTQLVTLNDPDTVTTADGVVLRRVAAAIVPSSRM